MSLNLFYFRRDLRLRDNHGLYQALLNGPTLCCYIWENAGINPWAYNSAQAQFIARSLVLLKQELQLHGSDLIILEGEPHLQLLDLYQKHQFQHVYCNEEYEQFNFARDHKIRTTLKAKSVEFTSYKDHVVFAKQEIMTKANTPYTVYTPYKRNWLSQLGGANYQSYPSESLLANLYRVVPQTNYWQPKITDRPSLLEAGEHGARSRLVKFYERVDEYHKTRDLPDLDQTSYLGVDLRFGTISVRQLVQFALSAESDGRAIWLSELAWREFFSQILYNFPHVVTEPFHKDYSKLKYTFREDYWDAWCNGQTGYPIVDAGMRQLNQTGFMHNRVRMICASFLCKDLLLDWRLGERYFADKLLDYDLASNNGNWQWCASTGCDAQPYFRIFNPSLQSERFDPQAKYIRKYVPELVGRDIKSVHKANPDELFSELAYPQPIVTHQIQASLAKMMFAELKNLPSVDK